MGWLVAEDCEFADMLAIRPIMQKKYEHFLQTLSEDDSVPARVLQLCKAQVDIIHGSSEVGLVEEELQALQKEDFASFDQPERAALKIAAKMPFQPHGIDDSDVEQLKAHFGNSGCVTLLTAIAFFDVSVRLRSSFSTAGEVNVH